MAVIKQQASRHSMEILRRIMILNTQRALKLNQKHKGETIFVIGSSPQLNEIQDDVYQELENRICIGVNRVQFKLRLRYFISAYISEVEMAKVVQPECVAIHMRPVYQPPIIEDILTVRRIPFHETYGLSRSFALPIPTLCTLKNVIFGATHLAIILGAQRIVYLGLEQRSSLHYYQSDENIKMKIAEIMPELKTVNIMNVDHEYESLEEKLNNLHKSPSELAQTPFPYKETHVDTFRKYFTVLESCGIEYYATKKESVVADAGAPIKPIEELLEGDFAICDYKASLVS